MLSLNSNIKIKRDVFEKKNPNILTLCASIDEPSKNKILEQLFFSLVRWFK